MESVEAWEVLLRRVLRPSPNHCLQYPSIERPQTARFSV